MVMGFAENYTCKVQDEVQAAHWTQEQVTLHPIIGYYDCKSAECQKPVMHSYIFISNDLTHDHHAVHVFSSKTVEMLKGEMSQPIEKVIRYSDGCTAQYKSKGPFTDISYSIKDNSVPIQHEFFGSRHRKGPSDGESAVIKRMASVAEMSGQVSISCAQEMYQYCEKNLTRAEDGSKCTHFKQTVLYIPREEINHKRARQGKTLNRTRSLHSVKCLKPGVVAWRNLSCFCQACIQGIGACVNGDYVDDWKVTQIQKATDMEEDEEALAQKVPKTKTSQRTNLASSTSKGK